MTENTTILPGSQPLLSRLLSDYCRSSKTIYVIISTSPHWNHQAQRWLAMFVCRKIRDAVSAASLYAVGGEGDWEHVDIIHIDMKTFRAKLQVDDLVILSCSHDCPVSRNLAENPPDLLLDFTAYAIDPGKNEYTYSGSDIENINKLTSLLSDTSSRQELVKNLYARISGDLSILSPAPFRIYAHPKCWSQMKAGLFIDAGAFDGAEAKWLSEKAPQGSKILSFEYDKDNFDKFLSNQHNDIGNIEFIHAGLWSHSGFGEVAGSGVGAMVKFNPADTNKADSGNPLITLDEFYSDHYQGTPVSFIKMDIEGAETEAIKGASTIIKEHRPALAISIYHKPSDLWEIPLLIHSLNPDYSFFISQHAAILTETVLYCA